MLAKQLLFAATAAAFLVVPDAPKDGEDIFRTLPAAIEPFELPASALSQSIEVPCKHCKGRDSHLKMDFEVQGDGKALMLNGFELYPNADPWHGDLVADVLRANGKPKEQRLGYGLAVRPEGMDERQHLEIIGVELRVVEVGRRFIGGVPTVKVKLIKAATGDIVIGGIDLLAPPPKNHCTTMVCRVKALAKDTWKSIKGCDKGHGHHGPHGHHGHHHGHDNLVLEGGKRPESPDHPHNHSWGKLFENVASYIFLPVVLGLVAGFSVALVAMALCAVGVRLTRCIRGRREARRLRRARRAARRSSRRSKHVVVEPAIEEEKIGLMDADEDVEDAPPRYEDN